MKKHALVRYGAVGGTVKVPSTSTPGYLPRQVPARSLVLVEVPPLATTFLSTSARRMRASSFGSLVMGLCTAASVSTSSSPPPKLRETTRVASSSVLAAKFPG